MFRLIYIFLLSGMVSVLFFACKEKRIVSDRLYQAHPDVLSDSLLWAEEIQQKEGSKVVYSQNKMEIDVSKGATIWFREKLKGEIVISYDITVIQNGGPNDRVSDMNCFWMFSDPREEGGSLRLGESSRNGAFNNYHTLQGYYVGLGGHNNTKTRFRRYDGNAERPLLPEHDLSDPAVLISPNQKYHVRLIARGRRVQYFRDDSLIFDIQDNQPYTEGWFGFRTVTSHMIIENFRVLKKGR
ncbi:MAG: DUF6250 domain-containing protein [Bacteroidia bacterium]